MNSWTRICSTNPLVLFNREVKRRTDAVQVFPNNDAVLLLAGAILVEMDDDWAAGTWKSVGLPTKLHH